MTNAEEYTILRAYEVKDTVMKYSNDTVAVYWNLQNNELLIVDNTKTLVISSRGKEDFADMCYWIMTLGGDDVWVVWNNWVDIKKSNNQETKYVKLMGEYNIGINQLAA